MSKRQRTLSAADLEAIRSIVREEIAGLLAALGHAALLEAMRAAGAEIADETDTDPPSAVAN